MQKQAIVLQQVIGAIGEQDFAAVVARAVLDWLHFDLATVVVHRRDHAPGLMFDNFDAVGANAGVRNYVATTHRLNPFLQFFDEPRAFRARDFRIRDHGIDADLRRYLVESPDEELGYRTIGWPEKLEEIGLYFEACTGVVELGIYRERATRCLPDSSLNELTALCLPVAAAFDRHAILVDRSPRRRAAMPFAHLSVREREVTELLLIGCSSDAIALRLCISRHTVKDHRKQIFRKLGIGTLAELFAEYHKRGH
ncbi:helix-turn-helix transcriptional regulator [Paraburkholderia xenovorans]|uniref:LuxR C-terminal-related transcriptional regulator n=1 Tax=Paraburkholderia xenovorans TaxID=36873 RepID=UPI0038B6DD5C